VPIIVINARRNHPLKLARGRLADVAPTLLDLMGLPKPKAMAGHSLVEQTAAETAA
jgi:2,3-bisphosphoglycerate-independent phosphoglycerate mutase